MQKLFILFILIILSINIYSQDFFSDKDIDKNKNRIVLIHPTVYNLETIQLLISKDLLKIDNLEIVGVYYEKEKYDYSRSLEWIKNDSSKLFFLHKLQGKLEIKDIFNKNELTSDFEKIFENSKGIIFMGGDDIPATVYQEKTNLLTSPYDPYRNFFETSFLYHLVGIGNKHKGFIESNTEYVCLAICLGMQTMNVANGGTLYQDIPTEVYKIDYAEDVLEMDKNNIHKNYNRWIDFGDSLTYGNLHKIKNKGKNEVVVYSNHHQCIEKLGADYYITATSMDEKIVEAIHHKIYKNVYGVQFHPENRALYDENLKYKSSSDEDAYFFGDKLKELNSYDYHLKFWEQFSSLIK